MGRITVTGKAEAEFVTDIITLSMTVQKKNKTHDSAVKSGKDALELLLSGLSEMDIPPDKCELQEESVSSDFQTGDTVFRKTILLKMKADLPLLEEITSMLSQTDGVFYDVDFSLSDPAALAASVADDAIEDSRQRAEKIASKLGLVITGAEEINDLSSPVMYAAPDCAFGALRSAKNSLSSKLTSRKETITREVSVTWGTERCDAK